MWRLGGNVTSALSSSLRDVFFILQAVETYRLVGRKCKFNHRILNSLNASVYAYTYENECPVF